ncbi:MAG: hypothetical protein CFE21_00480 [Bacteroidetes bacterium B1(2017)]|nr:MAG: hypothetical protein CFE21_00480 [Bacteroidetes bacterium B1(2017)]
MNTAITQIKTQFREMGIKSTIPRVLIFQSLMKFQHHPSAEEIHISIQKKYPGVSLATVYKTLDMLVQNNLAHKVVTDEDKVRYDSRTDQHIHLYCDKTKKISDYEDAALESLIADYLSTHPIPGFTVKQIQVNLKGECKTIKKNQ